MTGEQLKRINTLLEKIEKDTGEIKHIIKQAELQAIAAPKNTLLFDKIEYIIKKYCIISNIEYAKLIDEKSRGDYSIIRSYFSKYLYNNHVWNYTQIGNIWGMDRSAVGRAVVKLNEEIEINVQTSRRYKVFEETMQKLIEESVKKE